MNETETREPVAKPISELPVDYSHALHSVAQQIVPGRRMQFASWIRLEDVEPNAMQQIANLMALPCTAAVAVMPDVHMGYGMPIGCALATINAVVPYAVGVDVGCGMSAVRLGMVEEEVRRNAEAILRDIHAAVPVGTPNKLRDRNFGSHTTRQDSVAARSWAERKANDWSASVRARADYQVGTLGGGNHFIELQSVEAGPDSPDGHKGEAYLMIHTGSRAFGKAICDHYFEKAVQMAERYYTPLPDKDLAFIPLDTADGHDYLEDMHAAMKVAEENRAAIVTRCLEAIDRHVAGGLNKNALSTIETHHNFAAVEQHFGRKVVVHRKGAVQSAIAQLPIPVTIPGSMQTASYIGVGKPSVRAMNTCAHGAGRVLGRNEARRRYASALDGSGVATGLTMDGAAAVDIRADMKAEGIVLVAPEDSDVLDEFGRAYKKIEDVMAWQEDLVEPRVKLRPIGVLKG